MPRNGAAPPSLLREWAWWTPLLLAALALRLWLAARSSGLTMDSPLYVLAAASLARGELRLLGPAHHGYPALIALAHLLVPGRELPARAVALVAGLALVPLTWALARRSMPRLAAALATLVLAAHPLLAIYGVAIMTEAPFLALMMGALLLIERRRFAAGGALLGAAYAIRPEALVVAIGAALAGGAPGVAGSWRGAARMLALF